MRFQIKVLVIASLSLLLAACGDTAQLPEGAAVGPAPALPPPNPTLIPTVKIAPAKGWSQGMKPVPATDLSVDAYATGPFRLFGQEHELAIGYSWDKRTTSFLARSQMPANGTAANSRISCSPERKVAIGGPENRVSSEGISR